MKLISDFGQKIFLAVLSFGLPNHEKYWSIYLFSDCSEIILDCAYTKNFSTFFKTESGRVFLIYIKTYPGELFPEMHLGKELSIFFLELLELKTRQVFPTTCYVSGWLSWGFFWANSFKHVVFVALCAENYRICHEKWYLPVQRNILGKKWEALKICATFGLPEKISPPSSKLLFCCPNEYFGKKFFNIFLALELQKFVLAAKTHQRVVKTTLC